MKISKLIILIGLVNCIGCKYKPTPTHLICWPEHPTAVQGSKGTVYLSSFELDSIDKVEMSNSNEKLEGTLSSGQEFSVIRGSATCVAVTGYQQQLVAQPQPAIVPEPKPPTPEVKSDAGPK